MIINDEFYLGIGVTICQRDRSLKGKVVHGAVIHNQLLLWYLSANRYGILWDILKHHETQRDGLQRGNMPVLIDGTKYYSAAEIAKDLGISRSTFWRWRGLSEENLPVGRRYRGGKMVLFTEEEVEAIRGFANRLEPVQRASRDQMKLFNGVR
jgi:predicted DNA-binding transcriptional regulator AlpA